MVKRRNEDYMRDYVLTQTFGWIFAAFLFFRLSGGEWGFWLFCSGCSLLFSFFFIWAPISDTLVPNAVRVIKIVSTVMLMTSFALLVAEYVGLLGGSIGSIANECWRLPITLVVIVWVCCFFVSLAIQTIRPIALAQAKTGKRTKREVWLKSIALIAAGTGFLSIVLMPSTNINHVIIILAAGLMLLSLGIFLEMRR